MPRTWLAPFLQPRALLRTPVFLLLSIFLAAPPAEAQFTSSECPAWNSGEFRYVKLVTRQSDPTLQEPIRLAFDYRGEGRSDIYFAERHGNIKRWDAVRNEVSVLGHLDVFSDTPDKLPFAYEAETGINGLALDPGFKDNRRIWVFYSPWRDTVLRLSHFTLRDLGGRLSLDMASEKIIIEMKDGRKHGAATITLPGGPLHFDSRGDLWIAIGANSEQFPSVDERIRKRSAEASSSNLADLRGSILRIHPDGSARGYSIPRGNLGEYWAAEYARQGRNALAAEYRDPAKVLPEIYVKGTRNPYSMNVDPVSGAVVWGEFGPNKQRVEEFNAAAHPIYAGYPYWSGKNIFILDQMAPWNAANMNPQAPINASVWNEGPRELPPAVPSTIAYSGYDNAGFMIGNNPISGPIYRYDRTLNSYVKWPPHFDGAWIVADKWRGFRLFKMNASGDGYTDSANFYGAVDELPRWGRPVDVKAGPDGAIYVIDYVGYHDTQPTTHIGRYVYTGSCHPGVGIATRPVLPRRPSRLRIAGGMVAVEGAGDHVLRLRSLQGREVSVFRGRGPGMYRLPPSDASGIRTLTLESSGEAAGESRIIPGL